MNFKIPFFDIQIGKPKNEINEISNNSLIGAIETNRIYGQAYPIINRTFDGEKTLGELGFIQNTIPDYKGLRLRSYDAEMRTDIVKIISERFFNLVIGSGLKLQAEPNEDLLELENITDDFVKIKKSVEARFNTWARSKYADYSKMQNLHQKALEGYKTAFLGGDALVVCRLENNNLNVQIIDGIHVCDPVMTNYIQEIQDRKNFLFHGVEINSKGEHIAYYVKKNTLDYERIEVYGKSSKRKLAWFIYGDKKRVDHVRAIPQISQILEKINKIDRYAEATVGKAEQGANIPYTIEHDQYSTGEDVLQEIANKRKGITTDPDAGYKLADGLANKISQTTSNQVYNMPIGAKLKGFTATTDPNFDQFYNAIINSLCASVGAPPEVAKQMYNSNYSASRAAINTFDYVCTLAREKFVEEFYKPIYQLYFEIEVLKGKVPANGYLVALSTNDFMVTEAYSNCRFIGKSMPHIDPLKEVKAIAEMLALDLISREQATEMLNAGDWWNNYEKKKVEDEEFPEPMPIDNNNTNSNNSTNELIQS
ncbi:hypothetical protein [Flavobacterium phage V157]|uniref:Portal protein n=12 Tax=Ficleduovirus FCV1 TaxID=2560474 RepID=A0A218M8B5_9CAUD|nr:portal protein [Flavobacterium phage FCV-1]ASD51595.1 hypothetical protein [Flavobacterium phage FCV-3]ASD51669.1 hypothetical protein [Flavobacterium phage FCV-11]ASD51743.1 hypothetical protein [Flavobacterium phage V175]ASD51821.1 hypothetical protein [Flavobacterium phage V181]ASD52499.1 hypothetical protein [Flavobacterium phage FCV-10]ASD52572.1 hypothetical protein [Flavobacterium phage FCV-16]ASD52646.1 hypothetical protein [Flavobacterium phage FCV-20]ASD52719.1 hypothetical pro